jgi:hypothetical protein
MSSSSPFSPSSLAVDEPTLAATRLALHRLAFYVVSAAREAATGRIGLRSTAGGFGSPPFDDADGRTQVLRIEGRDLVIESDGELLRSPITTLGEAAAQVGITPDPSRGGDFDVPDIGPLDEPLDIDLDASALLGEWYRFGFDTLERVRSEAEPDEAATDPQLWPEHFDVGIDMGSAEAGARASYGASPGDDGHPEPYVYVAAWSDVDRSDGYWNDTHFGGASLGLSELAATADPADRALSFLQDGRRRLRR